MATIMKRPEVLAATGLCYTSIYNMEKRGNFPARRQLSARSVGWIRHEVEAWIEGLQQVAVPVAVPVAQS
jgi:prophage regulatory protein